MKILSIFVVQLLNFYSMKNFSEEERELIEAIRNYKNSLHNPSFELEEYAQMLFNNLMYGNED